MASEDYQSAIQKLMVEDITLVFVTLEVGVQCLNTAKISVTAIRSFKLMGRNSNIAQRHAFLKAETFGTRFFIPVWNVGSRGCEGSEGFQS